MGTELQTLNTNNRAEIWAERLTTCRNSGMPVKTWCLENGICEQTYYKWQRKLFAMAQAQQESRFAEVTPIRTVGNVAVTVRIAGAEAEIHTGADAATVETVLRALRSC